MKLNELIDQTRLDQLIKDKYVSCRPHPTLPLYILNYTPAAQSLSALEWDHTLSYCRGLVYEGTTYEVIDIPFKKFWNYGDGIRTGLLPEGLPRIFEKVDGSYLNLFFYKGEVVVSTRGSFESDQAKWAQKWVNERVSFIQIDGFDEEFNYIFEVVIPEDRKVVDYDFSGLVFLGYVRLQDGCEFAPTDKIRWLKDYRVAKELEYSDLAELQSRDLENQEGYVAVWYNKDSTFRVKLKFETYKLLHRMYFQTTSESIWEWCLLGYGADKISEQLKGADINLINWALTLSTKLYEDYDNLKHESSLYFRACIEKTNWSCDLESPEKERRKAFAMYATKYKHPALLFLMYDGRVGQYDEAIWKIIKPENTRFRKDEEC